MISFVVFMGVLLTFLRIYCLGKGIDCCSGSVFVL